MKTNTTLKQIIATLVLGLLTFASTAQNYNFTLIDNGSYSYTIAAEAQFDSGSFAPITQSYGFTLVLPDGITITINDVQPSGTNETVSPIPGTSVQAIDATMADKDLFLITTDTQGLTIPAHTNGQLITLVTLTVNGMPSTGEIRILDNNSTLASDPTINGSLDAFFQVDITNDSMVNFANEYNQLSGMKAFSFDTLSTPGFTEDLTLTLYPNPTSGVAIIRGTTQLKQIEVYNITGQRILTQDTNLSQIDISAYQTGIYLVRLTSTKGTETIKLIKN